MFDCGLFKERFLKERNQDLERSFEKKDLENELLTNIDIQDDIDNENLKVLSRGEKFKIVHPLAERLVEALVRCGTERVQHYAGEIEKIIVNIKHGRSMLYNMNAESVSESHTASNDSETKKSDDIDNKGIEVKGSLDGSVVCCFPPADNNPKKNEVFLADYLSLRPRNFLTNSLVDFKLRSLQPEGPAGQKVWLITNQMAQLLSGGGWWNIPRINQQLDDANLYQEGGCNIIVMAWCESNHFFAIVAVLDYVDKIYCLESIGGYREPLGLSIMNNFLKEIMRVRGLRKPDPFILGSPSVPKQISGSNECGLFLVENAGMILRNPDDFIMRAQTHTLSDWYPTEQVATKRQETAEQLKVLAEKQRQPGELLEGRGILTLPELVFQVVKL